MTIQRFSRWCLLSATLFSAPLFSKPLLAVEPVVLVTIKPLAWVVQALAPAGTDVQVLIPDGQSPHDYQLRPADVVRIDNSALLVWVGPGLEPWLVQVAGRISPAKQWALLPHSRHEHDADEHDDEHGHAEHENQDADHHGSDPLQDVLTADPHVWLDPLALREQAAPLAEKLAQLYPAKTDEIKLHLAQYQQAMLVLDSQIAALFTPVSAQGFVVYHDGYQRLVQRYHLQQRAAVWHHESIPAGARERSALLTLLNSGDVKCLFYEPEHGRDAVNGWLGSAAAKVKMVELDPLGETVAAGDDAYPRFIRGLTEKIAECLQRS